LRTASRSSGRLLRFEKMLEASIHDSLSIIVFRTTYGPNYGQFRIRKRSRMGGDARIRLILNNGLEMARKAVKTAGKRHGGGLEDERERTLSRHLGEGHSH
jgi:hypothetical protein